MLSKVYLFLILWLLAGSELGRACNSVKDHATCVSVFVCVCVYVCVCVFVCVIVCVACGHLPVANIGVFAFWLHDSSI